MLIYVSTKSASTFNGTGPFFTEYFENNNYGYGLDGYSLWQLVTDVGVNYDFGDREVIWEESRLRELSIDDYADTHPQAYINPQFTNINKGTHYLPADFNYDYISYAALADNDHGSANVAALLVRNSQAISVPEPTTLVLLLMATGLLTLRKKQMYYP